MVTSESKKVETPATSFTVTQKGITYKVNVNGNATVTKIKASGKVSINTVKVNGKTYKVTAIAANACRNNKTIKTLTLGSNVKSVGKNAFYGCSKLTKVTIKGGKSVKIEKGAFKKLSKGASIKIKGVKTKK